jgi:hypothetical protein
VKALGISLLHQGPLNRLWRLSHKINSVYLSDDFTNAVKSR